MVANRQSRVSDSIKSPVTWTLVEMVHFNFKIHLCIEVHHVAISYVKFAEDWSVSHEK